MIGREIGSYRITQRLGQGGVGEVFAGVDQMLNRPVAIKALSAEFGRDPGVVARFRGEAENLARLNHPNITTLYSMQREGDELFMIMELVRGQTLEALLLNYRRLSEHEALAVTAQALDGLAYAHNTGVIHRDIKTGNLMVAPTGLLKIMDFGIARVRGSGRLTRQGHIVGTLAYMSPEQIQGDEGDERSDLYSLAIVLYELLSGGPPFACKSEYELIRAQVEAVPPRLIDRVAALKPGIEDAVMRALAKRPADRFATAAEFGMALGISDLGGKAIDVVREGLGRVVSKATRIGVAALAKPLHDEGDVPGRPAARATRFAHGSEHESPETRIAQSRASRIRLRSGRLPAAALLIAAAMLTGVIASAVLNLTRGPVAVTQTESSELSPSSGDSAHAEGGTRTVPSSSIQSAMKAFQRGYAEIVSSGSPGTRLSDEKEPTPQRLPEAVATIRPPHQPTEMPETQPVPPDMVERLLSNVRCSALEGVVRGRTLVVEGYFGDRQSLAAGLEPLAHAAGSLDVSTDQVREMDPLYCRPLEVLRPLVEANRNQNLRLAVSTSGTDGRFREGDELLLTIKAPGRHSYVYVDYFSLDGNVVHMLPTAASRDNRLAASGQTTLGNGGPAGGWTVGEPFGTELITVISSPKPLFSKVRQEVEPSAGYLADLQKSLARADKPAGTAVIVGEISFIHTEPQS